MTLPYMFSVVLMEILTPFEQDTHCLETNSDFQYISLYTCVCVYI